MLSTENRDQRFLLYLLHFTLDEWVLFFLCSDSRRRQGRGFGDFNDQCLRRQPGVGKRVFGVALGIAGDGQCRFVIPAVYISF